MDGLSVTGSGANAFVNVHVPADKIKNGNAVISVKDASGTVMWSWQLWFAPQDVLTTVKCYNWDNKIFNFTTETLGWQYTKWEGTTYSSERSVRVKVEQAAGNPNSIKHPDTFYIYGDGETTFNYDNVWFMNGGISPTPSHVDKTIYDPCPVGFRVPDGDAFTGFSHDFGWGYNQCNYVDGDRDEFQNKFYPPYDASIYLPFIPTARDGSPYQWSDIGSPAGIGQLTSEYIGYWTLEVDGRSYNGVALGHVPQQWSIGPRVPFPKSYGLSVRPISE